MRGTRIFLVGLLLLLGGLGTSWAAKVKVIDADRLELRNIQLPGGDKTNLYVFSGSPVRLEVDGDLIIAERIEFDNESRLLRIVGAGDVAYDNVATKGRNYVLDLSSSQLSFQDVFIFTDQLDVQGVQAVRQPGQIDITAGAFSPCSRCGQDVQDYRFTAERMNLYPGDRLVAFNVTVYIRELPSFFLPLMVVPLGPPERQPRLRIQRGSEFERAEIALDWPYVFGANALGTVSLRYFADVFPGRSNSVTENLLGGTVFAPGNYFGGGFEHTFYTTTGQGNLDFFYTPPFLEYSGFDPIPIGQERDEYRFSVGYATEETLEGLQLDVLLDRDDASNDRIMNLTTRASYPYGGFDFNYVTQTYFDLDLDDDAETPAYQESEGALRTYTKLQASQDDEVTFSVGPFGVSNLLLEVGIYEDYASSANSSAFASPIYINNSPVIRSGRAALRHTITLEAFSPFSGASLSGSTDYTGQFYSATNPNGELERLVDWDTALSFDQTFAGGSFGLDYSRDILEGESPFQFDTQSTPANRTDLTSELLYSPLEWLDLSVRETYVFQGDRGSDDTGAGPIETRLDFFDSSHWFSASLEQRYDVEENDPGLLGASATFATLDSALTGSLTLSGAYDLSQRPADRLLEGTPINESEAGLEAELGYDIYGALDVALGYDFNAEPNDFYGDYGYYGSGSNDVFGDPEAGEELGEPRWTPLEVGLTVGTLEQEDDLPGLRTAWQFDVNNAYEDNERAPGSLNLELEASGKVGPVELSASQSFDFENQDASDSLFSVAYPDIIELEGSGFRLLPPAFFGLTPDPEDTVTYQLSLADLTQQDVEKLYEITYETSYGPDAFSENPGLGFRDTTLTAQLALPLGYLSTDLGSLGFGADFSSTLAIADDALPVTHLSNADLTLTTDFFSTFALQGTLAYDAIYDPANGGYSSQNLTFTDFGGTVRLFSDLYLSVIMNDTWDFASTTDYAAPYNFRPIFYLTLDRCCWAFYGAYNSENGTVSLTLGYPGSDTGITGAFNTGLQLPGRQNVGSGGGSYNEDYDDGLGDGDLGEF